MFFIHSVKFYPLPILFEFHISTRVYKTSYGLVLGIGAHVRMRWKKVMRKGTQQS